MHRCIIVLITALCLAGTVCKKEASEEERFLSRQLYTDGLKYENLGNLQMAETRYTGALAKNGASLEARLRLKDLYIGKKEYDKAIDLIEDAQAEQCWILTQAGIIQRAKGDIDKAAASFEKAIGKNPKFPTPYYFLGELAVKRGDGDKAKKLLQRYTTLYTTGTYRSTEEDYVQEAQRHLVRLEYPAEADRYLEALDLYRGGSPLKAEKALAKLASPPATVLRARILRTYDKNGEAIALLRKAGAYPEARALLLEMLYAKGDQKSVAEARSLATAILKENPADQRASFIMGMLLADEGKAEESRNYLNNASRSGGDELVALEARKLLETPEAAGKSLAPGMARFEKNSIAKSPHLGKLRAILKKLEASAGGAAQDVTVELHVYDDDGDEINALSFRDNDRGFIYVSDELIAFVGKLPLDREQRDDILACVIGHELCHIIDRHEERAYSLNGVLRSESLIATDETKDATTVAQNQAYEYEADRTGCMLAYLAGHNPFMLREFYGDLITARGDIPKQKDHPVFRERIARLNEQLVEMKAGYNHFRRGLADLSPRAGENGAGALARLDRAGAAFEAFRRVFPRNARAMNNLGLVNLQKALAGTAKRRYAYATSVSLTPGLVDPATLEKKAKRRTRGRQITEEAPKPQVRAIDRKKLEAAATYFEKALKADGHELAARNNLGIVYAYLGRSADARASFNAVLKAEPGNQAALNNLGVIELAAGNATEGRRLIRKAAEQGLAVAKKNLL